MGGKGHKTTHLPDQRKRGMSKIHGHGRDKLHTERKCDKGRQQMSPRKSNRSKTTQSSSVVTLNYGRGPTAKRVTVGIDVKIGAATREGYFEWSREGRQMVM